MSRDPGLMLAVLPTAGKRTIRAPPSNCCRIEGLRFCVGNAKRSGAGSRISREAHVQFYERAVVKFRRATRLVIFGEAHLRRILSAYAVYYNSYAHPSSFE